MSDSLLLDDKERDRFMIYCKLQADTAKGMIKVMEENNMIEVVIKREKLRVVAYSFVADELDRTESMSVG